MTINNKYSIHVFNQCVECMDEETVHAFDFISVNNLDLR